MKQSRLNEKGCEAGEAEAAVDKMINILCSACVINLMTTLVMINLLKCISCFVVASCDVNFKMQAMQAVQSVSQ